MLLNTSYDEKAAYEHRCRSKHSRHISHSSSFSQSSYGSSSSYFDKHDDAAPPPYAHIFYNTTEEKPLPPLPMAGSGWAGRRVRFVVEKPLPPLPSDGEERKRSRSSSSSRMGECAWWTRREGEGEGKTLL